MKWTLENPETGEADLDGAPTGTKKPYKKPLFIRMGSLRDITMTKSGGGANDGGHGAKNGTKRGGNFDGDASDP